MPALRLPALRLVPIACVLAASCLAQPKCCEHARQTVARVRAASYPELARLDIGFRPLRSDADYFQARFSLARFLTGRRMRYTILVNPNSTSAPEPAQEAILAHELAHVLYYSRGNRIHLLGLIRLASASRRARWERSADLEAIHRGYAEGLKQYRVWLYAHVPPAKLPEKRRDYLSPEEIDAAAHSR